MKKVSLLLAMFIAVSAFAQKHHYRKESLTTEQKTQLMIKKMTTKLDLNKKQVAQITPIIAEKAQKMEDRKTAMKAKRKTPKQERKEVSKNERHKIAMANLDEQAAFQNKMKSILNNEQYATWKKMQKKHHSKNKGKSKKKIAQKRENSED